MTQPPSQFLRTPAGLAILGATGVLSYMFLFRSTVAKEAGGMKNINEFQGRFTETSVAAANSPGGPGGSNRKD